MNVEIMNFKKTKKQILINFDKESFTFEDSDSDKSVNFSTILNNPSFNNDYQAYEMIENENFVLFNGETYVIKKCQEFAKGSIKAKEVTAIHITYTIQDDYQYDTISGKKSIFECLEHIFKVTKKNISFDVIDNDHLFYKVEQENFGNANLLKLIDEVATDYDAAIVRTNNLITFIPNEQFYKKTNNQIRYLYNTDDVSFDIDTYNFKTQIMGFGKKKEPKEGEKEGDYYFEPLIYTSPQAEYWGIRIQDPISDERFTIKENMMLRLKKELQDYPTVSGTVNMKQLDFEVERGDLVRFVYEPLNINQFIKVVGVTETPFSNKPSQITLDNQKKTMTSYVASLKKGG